MCSKNPLRRKKEWLIQFLAYFSIDWLLGRKGIKKQTNKKKKNKKQKQNKQTNKQTKPKKKQKQKQKKKSSLKLRIENRLTYHILLRFLIFFLNQNCLFVISITLYTYFTMELDLKVVNYNFRILMHSLDTLRCRS